MAFMSGSDSQQVAYTVTLFREAAHEWYIVLSAEADARPEIGHLWYLFYWIVLDQTFDPRRRSLS